MATSGKPLDEFDRKRVERLARGGVPIRRIARDEDLSRNTVRKILRNGDSKVTHPQD
jgi:DNA invertase Pin-like site-specific DNA recombinase